MARLKRGARLSTESTCTPFRPSYWPHISFRLLCARSLVVLYLILLVSAGAINDQFFSSEVPHQFKDGINILSYRPQLCNAVVATPRFLYCAGSQQLEVLDIAALDDTISIEASVAETPAELFTVARADYLVHFLSVSAEEELLYTVNKGAAQVILFDIADKQQWSREVPFALEPFHIVSFSRALTITSIALSANPEIIFLSSKEVLFSAYRFSLTKFLNNRASEVAPVLGHHQGTQIILSRDGREAFVSSASEGFFVIDIKGPDFWRSFEATLHPLQILHQSAHVSAITSMVLHKTEALLFLINWQLGCFIVDISKRNESSTRLIAQFTQTQVFSQILVHDDSQLYLLRHSANMLQSTIYVVDLLPVLGRVAAPTAGPNETQVLSLAPNSTFTLENQNQ